MIKTRLFKSTFGLLLLVGLLNLIATYFYLYWTVWWFDMVEHFLAGACVAMASVLVYYFYNKQQPLSFRTIVMIAIASSLIVGITWELYELSFQITYLSDGLDYYLDTGSDLLMDISGGILGALYAYGAL